MQREDLDKMTIDKAFKIHDELMSRYYANHNMISYAIEYGEKWARENFVTETYDYAKKNPLTLYGRERSLVCYFHLTGCKGIARPNLSLYLITEKISACDNCVNNYLNSYLEHVTYAFALSQVLKKKE